MADLSSLADPSLDQKTRIDRYKQALSQLLGSPDVSGLKAFVEHVASESVALVVSRQVLSDFAAALAPDKFSADQLKELGLFVLERIGSRLSSFEEQASNIRERLAAVYEQEEEWTLAAKMLAAIPLDSGIRVLEDDYKIDKYIHIAMLFLQDEESVSAETYINRASLLISDATDGTLRLKHKVCYARILDSKRKFLEAATRYYQLSQLAQRTFGTMQVSDEEVVTALRMATTCAILAPAGPQRSRMLGTLYKDERTQSLSHYSVLEKMYMERLLRPAEVTAFASSLATHQKATLEDGSTVLDRAVIEHNMLAASRLYANITFEQLGALLGSDGVKAERVAASMLMEKRLQGSIDQPEFRLHFEHLPASADADSESADALHAFDAQIENICRSVEAVANSIAAKHPELVVVAATGA